MVAASAAVVVVVSPTSPAGAHLGVLVAPLPALTSPVAVGDAGRLGTIVINRAVPSQVVPVVLRSFGGNRACTLQFTSDVLASPRLDQSPLPDVQTLTAVRVQASAQALGVTLTSSGQGIQVITVRRVVIALTAGASGPERQLRWELELLGMPVIALGVLLAPGVVG